MTRGHRSRPNLRLDRHEDTPLVRAMRVARTHAGILVAIPLVAATAAAAATVVQPVTYRATTTLVVRTEAGRVDTETVARTLSALLRSEAVAAEVRRTTGIDLPVQEIADRITVERPPGSGVLSVRFTDSSRARSLAVAEAIPGAFSRMVGRLLQPAGAAGGAPDAEDVPYLVRSWDPRPAVNASDPPAAANAAIGFALGLMLAGAIVVVREQQFPLVHSVGQAERGLGFPVVATVPRLVKWRSDPIRPLAALLEELDPARRYRCIVVLPADPRSGAALALALGFARAAGGREAVVVDADLPDAALTEWLGLGSRSGVGDVPEVEANGRYPHPMPLTDDRRPRGTRRWARDRTAALHVVPAGKRLGVNALAPGRIGRYLRSLRRGRTVIVSGPSGGGAPLAGLLDSADLVLAVATRSSTRLSSVSELGARLSGTDVPVFGILVAADGFQLREEVVAPPAPLAARLRRYARRLRART